MNHRVLVVEDERSTAELIKLYLDNLDYTVELAFDGLVGLAEAESGNHDLIILDLILPGMDGLEICRRLRAQQPYIPILMLTARSAELDRVLGLEMGADDYLIKPFSILELMARVKTLFRRMDALNNPTGETEQDVFRAGDLVVDRSRRAVILRGQALTLTPKMFGLLLYFIQHPGRVYTRGQLLDAVWGHSYSGYEHTVNFHVNQLRAKIERDPAHPEYILTVRGIGYKFTETPPDGGGEPGE